MPKSTEPTWMRVLEAVAFAVGEATGQNVAAEGIRVEAATANQLILRARAQRDMSRKELAELSGVSEVHIRWYEESAGESRPFWKPSFDELVAIKRALRIHPDSVRKFL